MYRDYARRVSTTDQNLDIQIQALQEAGDTVIVKELIRVSRSTPDMLNLVQQITDKGCYVKSLNENWLDTGSPAGELILTVFAGLAQFERNLMLQRCAKGRTVAKATLCRRIKGLKKQKATLLPIRLELLGNTYGLHI